VDAQLRARLSARVEPGRGQTQTGGWALLLSAYDMSQKYTGIIYNTQ
jgi:hypothetical protein